MEKETFVAAARLLSIRHNISCRAFVPIVGPVSTSLFWVFLS